MNPVEIAAACCTLGYVLLAARGSVWCWPLGIAGAILYIIFDLQLKYYQDALLQCYYVAAGCYGWFWWNKNITAKIIPYTSVPYARLSIPLVLCTLLIVPFGWIFSKLGNAYSYLDAATTLFSFLATWYTARKVLQSWLLWIVINLVLAIQYHLKEAHISSALYLLMAGIAVYGYTQWKQSSLPLPAPKAPVKPL